MSRIKIFPDPETLSKAAARFFCDTAIAAAEKHGQFSVALSGGSSPEQTYELLTSPPLVNTVPWEKTYVFWGDERFVPTGDPQNNARMARRTLLDHVPIPPDQIFPIPTDGTHEEAAAQYANILANHFGDEFPRFDLILLGLGTNGHTASLFPGKEVLDEKEKWVSPVFLEDKDQYRITLTLPVINNARNGVFMVFGKSKARVVAEVLQGSRQPRGLPAQRVNLQSGSLYWFIDEAAGSRLKDL